MYYNIWLLISHQINLSNKKKILNLILSLLSHSIYLLLINFYQPVLSGSFCNHISLLLMHNAYFLLLLSLVLHIFRVCVLPASRCITVTFWCSYVLEPGIGKTHKQYERLMKPPRHHPRFGCCIHNDAGATHRNTSANGFNKGDSAF